MPFSSGTATEGPSGVVTQSLMTGRREGLTKQEALQRGCAIAHRSVVYVHADLRNFDVPGNKAVVR